MGEVAHDFDKSTVFEEKFDHIEYVHLDGNADLPGEGSIQPHSDQMSTGGAPTFVTYLNLTEK